MAQQQTELQAAMDAVTKANAALVEARVTLDTRRAEADAAQKTFLAASRAAAKKPTALGRDG